MNQVELISGLHVIIPNREFALLKKMLDMGTKTFDRDSMSPRAQHLANSLVGLHVLDRNDDDYILRQFTIL